MKGRVQITATSPSSQRLLSPWACRKRPWHECVVVKCSMVGGLDRPVKTERVFCSKAERNLENGYCQCQGTKLAWKKGQFFSSLPVWVPSLLSEYWWDFSWNLMSRYILVGCNRTEFLPLLVWKVRIFNCGRGFLLPAGRARSESAAAGVCWDLVRLRPIVRMRQATCTLGWSLLLGITCASLYL